MKLFAPKYYRTFKCIADKCKHSCCIGWEIDIDGETLKKYHTLGNGYGSVIKCSVDNDPAPHFRLGEGERCPHLSENGLCKIITELSESYLCEICREHPRFYNFTPYGADVGLGMACEEACGIILRSDLFGGFETAGDIEGEAEEFDFDPIPIRQWIFDILSDDSLSHSSKLKEILGICSENHREYSDEEIRDILLRLEYMNDKSKAIICDYSQQAELENELEKPLERALAYFIYRHCTEALSKEDFKISLSFSLLCELLLASLIENIKEAEVYEMARILSEEIEYNTDNIDKIKELFIDEEIL